jgi:hypothetical protein
MKKTILGAAIALAISGTSMADAINHFEFEVFSSDDKMHVLVSDMKTEQLVTQMKLLWPVPIQVQLIQLMII